MHNCYRGRCHTKKQHNTCKPKITSEERARRKKLKHLASIFPQIKFNLFLPVMKKQHELR